MLSPRLYLIPFHLLLRSEDSKKECLTLILFLNYDNINRIYNIF